MWLAYAFTISVTKMAGDDTLGISWVVYITICCQNSYDIVHCYEISIKCCVRTGINWSLRSLKYVRVRRLNRLPIHETPNLGDAKTNDQLSFRLLLWVCIGLSGIVTTKLQSLFRVQDRSWARGSISSRWAVEHQWLNAWAAVRSWLRELQLPNKAVTPRNHLVRYLRTSYGR